MFTDRVLQRASHRHAHESHHPCRMTAIGLVPMYDIPLQQSANFTDICRASRARTAYSRGVRLNRPVYFSTDARPRCSSCSREFFHDGQPMSPCGVCRFRPVLRPHASRGALPASRDLPGRVLLFPPARGGLRAPARHPTLDSSAPFALAPSGDRVYSSAACT